MLKIGSLFSGYGGLDIAVENVTGGKVVWHCEVSDGPSKILEHNYPGMPNLGDISKVDWSKTEHVDVLTGGFPCQDLSAAGKHAGIKEGTRSGLWLEFVRAIEAIKPRLVVVENVRGILNGKAYSDLGQCEECVGDGSAKPHLRALGAVAGSLANLGYDCRWTTVRAADAGAPHKRERVYIIGYLPASNSSN